MQRVPSSSFLLREPHFSVLALGPASSLRWRRTMKKKKGGPVTVLQHKYFQMKKTGAQSYKTYLIFSVTLQRLARSLLTHKRNCPKQSSLFPKVHFLCNFTVNMYFEFYRIVPEVVIRLRVPIGFVIFLSA